MSGYFLTSFLGSNLHDILHGLRILHSGTLIGYLFESFELQLRWTNQQQGLSLEQDRSLVLVKWVLTIFLNSYMQQSMLQTSKGGRSKAGHWSFTPC